MHKHKFKIVEVGASGYIKFRCQIMVMEKDASQIPRPRKCRERMWGHRSFFRHLTLGNAALVRSKAPGPQWILDFWAPRG
jgi:hypothetical protein